MVNCTRKLDFILKESNRNSGMKNILIEVKISADKFNSRLNIARE